MSIYTGVNNVARNVSSIYVGVNGTARKVLNGYVGVNGVARQFYASFTSPLNTDQLTLGMKTVYFKAYPSIKWQVQHLDGDYVYLALTEMSSEVTAFNPSSGQTAYAGSTIAAKCTTFLNNTIPNVANYLENVTVNGVTNKVFIPSYKMFSGNTGYGGLDANDPTFSWPSASAANRVCNYQGGGAIHYWLSSAFNTIYVWFVAGNGYFNKYNLAQSIGFRPCVKVKYKQ